MKKLLLIALSFTSFVGMAQYSVGHTTITFNDPGRTGGFGSGGGAGRQIQTEIYYPATSAGDNTPVAVGEFPVISFGHGFAMSWDAYENVWEAFAAEGFIIAFPRTEGGLFPSPSHSEFGLDLALVANKLLALNATTGSIFLNKINGNAAIMGHSMGGGATFLAASGNSAIKAVVGLAPAETNPSAVTAAAGVTVPTLILSGSSDGVTPAADHHTPIYNAVTASCKYFLSITGGAHCYFANTNLNCDFGESTSSTGITIDRAEQQAVMNDYVLPWLTYYLKEDCAAWTEFTGPQASDSRIVPTSTCNQTIPTAPTITLGSNVLVSSSATNNQWYLNGSILPGETNATCPLTYGNGSYTVANTSNPTCNAMSAPYVYTSGTGNVNELSLGIKIQPNPADDVVEISLNNTESYEVSILSIDGKVVMTDTFIGTSKINVSSWNRGMYLIQISQSGRTSSKKLLVK
jgi:dienelactone hydrolase